MEIILRNPFYLWFLLVVPLVILAHFLSLNYSKKRAIKFVNFIALARVSEKVGISANYTVLVLRIFAFVAVIFAISGTSIWYEGSQIDADYVIAIDSSASMLAEDFFPSRLDAAKDAANSFIDNLPIYSSVGVVAFSGTSYIVQPLTGEKQNVKSAINGVEVTKSGGTDVASAIITGTNLLINSDKPRVVIVLTDGRSNVGLSADQAISYANKHRIIVNTIGVGSGEDYFVELDGEVGSLGVDGEELEFIARLTGGKYYESFSSEDLEGVYEKIANIEKSKVSLDLTFFLLVFILFILLLEWILINTKFKILP